MVPTVQMRGAAYAVGTPGHSWQFTAQGKAPAAHKGLEHVAKVMAGNRGGCDPRAASSSRPPRRTIARGSPARRSSIRFRRMSNRR